MTQLPFVRQATHEMRRTPCRSRCRLRLLRTGLVRRLRQTFGDATHGLLGRLRGGAHTRRPGHAIDPAKEPAKRVGQRVLLLSLRRTFGGGGRRRVVLSAAAVPDCVHGRLQRRLRCRRNLVWPDCAETKTLNPKLAVSKMYSDRLTAKNQAHAETEVKRRESNRC